MKTKQIGVIILALMFSGVTVTRSQETPPQREKGEKPETSQPAAPASASPGVRGRGWFPVGGDPQDKATSAPSPGEFLEGIVQKLDLDLMVLDLDTGGRSGQGSRIVFRRETPFLVGEIKVRPSAAKPGMKVAVTASDGGLQPGPWGLPYAPTYKLASAVRVIGPTPTTEPAHERFVDNGGGTLTDTKTKLMWQVGCDGKLHYHAEALKLARECTLGGHKDWRLPKADEWEPAIVAHLMSKRISKGPADLFLSDDPAVHLPFNYEVTFTETKPARLKSDTPALLDVTAEAYMRLVRSLSSQE